MICMTEDGSIWGDLRKWLSLKHQLERALQELEKEESYIMEELDRVEEQVAYYGSLTKDMKKALDPPNLSHLLQSWRRG